jgi:hypothetical protein
MADWAKLFARFVPKANPATRQALLSERLRAPANPDLFRKTLNERLTALGMMPKQDLREVMVGRDWARLKQLSPELFKQKTDQSAEIGKRISDAVLQGSGFVKKSGLVAQVGKAFGQQMHPLRAAANAAVPPFLAPGTVRFARDIARFRNGTLADKTALPLTNSALRNLLIPTTTGIVADRTLPDGWLGRMWNDLTSLKPVPGR